MDKERLMWPDIAKGFAIFFVVLLHTGDGIINAGLKEPSWWRWVYNAGYTFMVPLFFFISGMFCEQSRKSLNQRFITIGKNIFYPYVLWSIIQFFLIYMSGVHYCPVKFS